MSSLSNVRGEIRGSVSQDKLASQFAEALSGMFTIEHYKRVKAYEKSYITLHCKPTRTIAESLLLEREVLAIIINVDEVLVRTLHVAKDRIDGADGRLDPSIVIIVHSDPRGDEKLRSWGREQGLKIIPIFRPKTGALPTSEVLRRHLAQDLFSLDPFQITGPVISDGDFFGRRNDAIEQLRQLQSGRIKSLFGR